MLGHPGQGCVTGRDNRLTLNAKLKADESVAGEQGRWRERHPSLAASVTRSGSSHAATAASGSHCRRLQCRRCTGEAGDDILGEARHGRGRCRICRGTVMPSRHCCGSSSPKPSSHGRTTLFGRTIMLGAPLEDVPAGAHLRV